MSDLKWIPAPESRTLKPGAYWWLGKSGNAWVVVSEAFGLCIDLSVTHYCPIPEPVMPTTSEADRPDEPCSSSTPEPPGTGAHR